MTVEYKDFKIQAYVSPENKAFLVELAKRNKRKISAQLDVILEELRKYHTEGEG